MAMSYPDQRTLTMNKEIDLEEGYKLGKKSELRTKPAKSGNTGQRGTKKVLAELVGRLRQKLNPKVALVSPSDRSPNLFPFISGHHRPFWDTNLADPPMGTSGMLQD